MNLTQWTLRSAGALVCAGLLLSACPQKEDTPPAAAAPSAAPATAPPAAPTEEPAASAPTAEKAAAQHILIQFGGAARAPAELTRTREQARALAEELAGLARAEGADFTSLAKQRSEDPNTAPSGGMVGTFTRGQMVPEFEQAVLAVQPGQITEVVETAFGYHVIKRLPVDEVAVHHILIQFSGAEKAAPGVTRTREEARKLADELRLSAIAPGADFTAMARESSDCASKSAGGDLGAVGRGMTIPAFEAAAFALKVGEISQVVETPLGFHIILRDR